MFVVVVIKHLEGERDYGKQTLATPTHQRSHFLRGVVQMVLVSFKVQGVKSQFLSISQKRSLYDLRKHICARQEHLTSCISLFGKCLAVTKQ